MTLAIPQRAFCIFLIAFATGLPVAAQGAENLVDFTSLHEEVLELGQLTNPPIVHDANGFVAEGVLKPIFFEALPWKGKPTRVFAWLGVPEQRTGEVPGIVLVHGGGGTAFNEWVLKWNEHGFAAIAIAVEGQTDQRKPDGKRGDLWERHEWAGPTRVGIFADSAEPLNDQWIHRIENMERKPRNVRAKRRTPAGLRRLARCGPSLVHQRLQQRVNGQFPIHGGCRRRC